MMTFELTGSNHHQRKVYPDLKGIDEMILQHQQEKEKEEQQMHYDSPIRGEISATRSSTKLMRQISALGMEDPIFRTTEFVPEHPSNIFDDMGFHDLPTDMLDLMSVASDPTATCGVTGLLNNIDESFINQICFAENSSHDNQHNSMRLSKLNKVSGHSSNQNESAISTEEITDRSPSSHTADNGKNSSSAGFLLMSPTSYPKRKMGILHSNSVAQRIKNQNKDNGNGIITASPQRQQPDNNHMNLTRKVSTRRTQQPQPWIPTLDSRGMIPTGSTSNNSSKRTEKMTSSRALFNSSQYHSNDPLMAEAAKAYEQQQQLGRSGCTITTPTHTTTTATTTTTTSGTSPKDMKETFHSKITHTTNTTNATSITEKERRVLPTLSGLFSP